MISLGLAAIEDFWAMPLSPLGAVLTAQANAVTDVPQHELPDPGKTGLREVLCTHNPQIAGAQDYEKST